MRLMDKPTFPRNEEFYLGVEGDLDAHPTFTVLNRYEVPGWLVDPTASNGVRRAYTVKLSVGNEVHGYHRPPELRDAKN